MVSIEITPEHIESALTAVGIKFTLAEEFFAKIHKCYNKEKADEIISLVNRGVQSDICDLPADIIDMFYGTTNELLFRTSVLNSVMNEVNRLFIDNNELIRIVDAGCGVGIDACTIGNLFKDKVRIVGYDINEKAISFARSRAEKVNLDNVSFYISDHKNADKLGLPPQDIVMGIRSGNAKNLEETIGVYTQLNKLIKVGGYGIVQSFFDAPLVRIEDLMQHLVKPIEKRVSLEFEIAQFPGEGKLKYNNVVNLIFRRKER